MNWTSALAVYFIIWWIVLFAVLPFGVRNANEAGEVVLGGNEAGAPVRHGMRWKLFVTTLVSLGVFAAVLSLHQSGFLEQLDLPFFPDITY